MREKLIALKIYQRPIPAYPKKMLNQLGKNASMLERLRIFIGTLKRLHEKRF